MYNSFSQCPVCSHGVENPNEKCSSSGYPFSGTEKEKSIFIANQIMNKEHMLDTGKTTKQARFVLIVIGGLIIFSGNLTQQVNPFSIAISIGVGSIFFFGSLTKKRTVYFYYHPINSFAIKLRWNGSFRSFIHC